MKLLVLIPVLLFSAMAHSQTYQYELNLGGGELFDEDGFRKFSANFYLSPVSVEGLPLAEAGFLTRSDRIFYNYQHLPLYRRSFESLSPTLESFDNEIHDIGFEGYYNKLYVSPAYRRNSHGDNEASVEIGYISDNNWLISARHSDDKSLRYFRFKSVSELGNGNYLNLEFSSFDDDALGGNNQTTALVDYYIDQTLSIGARLRYTNDALLGNGGDLGYGIRINKFITENTHIGVETEHIYSVDSFTLDFTVRF